MFALYSLAGAVTAGFRDSSTSGTALLGTYTCAQAASPHQNLHRRDFSTVTSTLLSLKFGRYSFVLPACCCTVSTDTELSGCQLQVLSASTDWEKRVTRKRGKPDTYMYMETFLMKLSLPRPVHLPLKLVTHLETRFTDEK